MSNAGSTQCSMTMWDVSKRSLVVTSRRGAPDDLILAQMPLGGTSPREQLHDSGAIPSSCLLQRIQLGNGAFDRCGSGFDRRLRDQNVVERGDFTARDGA